MCFKYSPYRYDNSGGGGVAWHMLHSLSKHVFSNVHCMHCHGVRRFGFSADFGLVTFNEFRFSKGVKAPLRGVLLC